MYKCILCKNKIFKTLILLENHLEIVHNLKFVDLDEIATIWYSSNNDSDTDCSSCDEIK